jgi:hypothetical protein
MLTYPFFESQETFIYYHLQRPEVFFVMSDIDWDVVIAPGNHSGLQDILRDQGAVNIPRAWGVERSAWFFIRPEE